MLVEGVDNCYGDFWNSRLRISYCLAGMVRGIKGESDSQPRCIPSRDETRNGSAAALMRKCLFCDNEANSKEHIIPTWLLRILPKLGSEFRFKIGNKDAVVVPSIERTVKAVCTDCNSGWMSALEVEAAPLIRSFAFDISRRIDEAGACALALWSIKTSMMNEASVRRKYLSFTQSDYESVRNHEVPLRSFVWLGRLNRPNHHDIQGTDFPITLNGADEAASGCVTTFLIGHLIIQVLHVKVKPPYDWPASIAPQSKSGPWSVTLQQIWPYVGNVTWPPPEDFDLVGGTHFYNRLANRWRIGTRMPMKEIGANEA